MTARVQVVGAGMAGLAAAVALTGAGAQVRLSEAAGQAGGRCRSFHDPQLGMTIDNGNHLLLSGNHATLDHLRRIGAEGGLQGPAEAEFAFADLASGERWTLRLNPGRLPWWILRRDSRPGGTRLPDYLLLGRLLWRGRHGTVGEVIRCDGPLYQRLLRPLLTAALNIDPPQASAPLAAALIRETLGAGGAACRPLVAAAGLGAVFVDPALDFLRRHGAGIRFERRLRAIATESDRVVALDFGDGPEPLAPAEALVLAVPPGEAARLLPGLEVPGQFRAVLNIHFRIPDDEEVDLPAMIGLVNGTAEWIFRFPGRLSVTISNADRLLHLPRRVLAQRVWDDVARLAGRAGPLPPWQVVKERRATFAALPEEERRRPPARTRWRNLFLAGDWTSTGLPATIEGAIRSGRRAAGLVLQDGAASCRPA